MKKCPKCKVEKDESCFSKNKSTADGLSWNCRVCRALAYKAYSISHAGRVAHSRAVRQYQASEKGRAAYRASTAAYCGSEKGKAKRREYYRSPAGRATLKRYRDRVRLRRLAVAVPAVPPAPAQAGFPGTPLP